MFQSRPQPVLTSLRSAIIVATALSVAAVSCAAPTIPVPESASGVVIATPIPSAIPSPTPAATPTPLPRAVEPDVTDAEEPLSVPTALPVPGLSATQIRIGTIVDLDTGGVADNLGLGSYEATKAWVASVNERGGLAGRQVQLVLADTRLFSHEQAVEVLCSNDIFALVGSNARADEKGVDLLNSSACGLPDFPAAAHTTQRRASAVTILSNPYLNPLYQGGPLRWLAQEFPEAAAKSSVVVLPLFSNRVDSERTREAAVVQGFEFIYDPQVVFDEDYTTHVEEMESLGVESLVWTGDSDHLIEFLGAKTQTRSSEFSFVLCEADCYSTDFLVKGGALVEGVSTWIPHLPFDEVGESPELGNFMFALATSNDEFRPSTQGVSAWAAGRLMEEAVARAVGAGTPAYDAGALTRESLLASVRTIDEWTAEGLYGRVAANPAAGIPSPCFVLMQVVDGQWARQHPTAPGTMDCLNANRVALTASTAELGITESDSDPTVAEPGADEPGDAEG